MTNNSRMDAIVNERYGVYFRNHERGTKPVLTRNEVEEIKKEGRLTIHVYPRKKVICLNGYMYFDLKD